MFGHGKSRKHKKETSKKHHIRNWIHLKKKKNNEANLFAVIMSSDDQSSPAQTSISTTSFDVVDNARLEKINITPIISQPTKPMVSPTTNTDADAIEEAVSIVQTTLPMPELQPKLEKNGIETKTKKSSDEPNDDCLINCIYYTQQCCDCTIV